MKLFVSLLVVFLALVVCNAKVRKTYGDITTYKVIGNIKAFGAPEYNGRIHRNITFPEVMFTCFSTKILNSFYWNCPFIKLIRFLRLKDSSEHFIIYGIKHYDYEDSAPSLKFKTPTGSFESGSKIEFDVISEFDQGLSSIFFFYGIEV